MLCAGEEEGDRDRYLDDGGKWRATLLSALVVSAEMSCNTRK